MKSDTVTPLSVAFIWHMHQPEYKDHLTDEYLMPWSRLHATKDYLDMVSILEKYPKIRQTFNLVPSLIDQIEDYCKPETRDRHMTITLQERFSDDDRLFIFQRFFDASPENMIGRSPYYYSLFDRRNRAWHDGEPDITEFTDQEYQDITALFNMVWIDPLWINTNPDLKQLWNKQQSYSLSDRTRIIEIQRDIIRQVLPTYRKLQEQGQIEITTTPYYHPILPLIIDSESARVAMPNAVLPEEPYKHPDDAAYHVIAARQRYEELFGSEAVGVWPAEQSISPEAIRLLKQHGFQWAVSSEGNLSASLGVPLHKDHFGNITNVEVLCQAYQYDGVNLLFRHLALSDLIGFTYASMSPHQAVEDFLQRLRQIQKQCARAGLNHPIVTIALDGENCWEFFPEDGHEFLNLLYTALSKDETFNVCRVRDYFESVPEESIKKLNHLHSGSWINSDFHIWIGDPVKNAAWTYLSRTRKDLEHLSKTGHYQPELLKQAWQEIYIAEGSDWFWWYGEPHNSGQDEIFDMQFRRHLANVYRLVDMAIPDFLEIPLTVTMGRPVIHPRGPILPTISGLMEHDADWEDAGYFDLTHGAMHRATRILNKVYFGSDDGHFYLRLDLNKSVVSAGHAIHLYFITPGKTRYNSPVRVKSGSGRTVPTQRYHYAYEVSLNNLIPGQLWVTSGEAMSDHLWYNRTDIVKAAAYEDVLELAVSFNSMNINSGEYLQFGIALVQGDVVEEFQPNSYLLSIQRCEPVPVVQPVREKAISER